MTKDKNIYINNIYHMLSYAFQALKREEYDDIAGEKFEDLYNLFAAILSKAISGQIKTGLYRTYIESMNNLSTVRGRIHIADTIRDRVARKSTITCEYDEFSENNLMNQILKSVAILLLRHDEVADIYRDSLRNDVLFLSGVEEIDVKAIPWHRLQYHRGNETYQMLMGLCKFIIDGMLLTTESGEYKLAQFADSQEMHRLYEKFILEYYRTHHKELHAHPDQISWNVAEGTDKRLLPAMKTDITLHEEGKRLIIDAKFYSKTLQSSYETNKIHSGNLFQIYTYVKEADKEKSGDVSGMLLYARTEDKFQPDEGFPIDKNWIGVKTLDLNKPWNEVRAQLEKVVDDWRRKRT